MFFKGLLEDICITIKRTALAAEQMWHKLNELVVGKATEFTSHLADSQSSGLQNYILSI